MADLPVELWHSIFEHLEDLVDLSSCAGVQNALLRREGLPGPGGRVHPPNLRLVSSRYLHLQTPGQLFNGLPAKGVLLQFGVSEAS